jgi:hypothetical protein
VIDKAPDIREYCFNEDAPLSPDMMLAVWVRTYLTEDQFNQFKVMVKDYKSARIDKITVEQMLIMIDVVTTLY